MEVKQYTISPDTTVREAIKKIDEKGKKIIFITDSSLTLLGVFSDGDMRKYILRNGDLNVPIRGVMNRNPRVFKSIREANKISKTEKLVAYPIIDEDHKFIDVLFWNDDEHRTITEKTLVDIPVVIMAGGKGTRLYPYTQILPKPLIPIGDYTISERIINNFKRFGCDSFSFILNYKGSMIKAYFNDIDRDYNVDYFDETTFLGTGGGLYLLKNKINSTFFLSNCDIIIDADYGSIYEFHKQHKNLITFVCAFKNFTIPYGVVNLDNSGKIQSLLEKPSYSYLTNTGFYVIEPEVIQDLKENEFIDLPDIASSYIEQGKNVGVYPVSENAWLDMGQFTEMQEMFKALGVE